MRVERGKADGKKMKCDKNRVDGQNIVRCIEYGNWRAPAPSAATLRGVTATRRCPTLEETTAAFDAADERARLLPEDQVLGSRPRSVCPSDDSNCRGPPLAPEGGSSIARRVVAAASTRLTFALT